MPIVLGDYIKQNATLSKIFSDNPLIFGLILTLLIVLIAYLTFPMKKSKKTPTRLFKFMIYISILCVTGTYLYYSAIVSKHRPAEKSLLQSEDFYRANRQPRDGLEVRPQYQSAQSNSSYQTATGLDYNDKPAAADPSNMGISELFEKSDDILARLNR